MNIKIVLFTVFLFFIFTGCIGIEDPRDDYYKSNLTEPDFTVGDQYTRQNGVTDILKTSEKILNERYDNYTIKISKNITGRNIENTKIKVSNSDNSVYKNVNLEKNNYTSYFDGNYLYNTSDKNNASDNNTKVTITTLKQISTSIRKDKNRVNNLSLKEKFESNGKIYYTYYTDTEEGITNMTISEDNIVTLIKYKSKTMNNTDFKVEYKNIDNTKVKSKPNWVDNIEDKPYKDLIEGNQSE